MSPNLPIHFFTIVLNGEPFIRYHLEIFKRLKVPWHWHIVEGVAELKHDTAWSVAQGGKIPGTLHHDGLSVDGTTSYLDQLKIVYPEQISLYRKPRGTFWDGKREMIAAPLATIREPALLWQLDSDELWTVEQIETLQCMFVADPARTAAWFWCWYFVSPDQVISTRNCYAQNPASEWLRVWRYEPGMFWASHEPPVLAVRGDDGNHYNVGLINPFRHAETEAAGLIFQHFSYVTRAQVEFKESYYGYRGAVAAWERLQAVGEGDVKLRDYFAWVGDDTQVARTKQYGVVPLAQASGGRWQFDFGTATGRAAGGASTPTPKIVIDGVFFQIAQSGIARLWASLLKVWSQSEFAREIVVLDRNGSAPKFPGLAYRMTPAYQIGNLAGDQALLQRICEEERAALFVSTYYTRPQTTPSFQLVYDMIPEVMGYDLVNDPRWLEKQIAFSNAVRFACISEHTKRDLLRFHPQLNPAAVPVIYPACDREIFAPASPQEIVAFYQRYEINRPYFIIVGPSKGYKNVECFFEGMQKLGTQYGFEALLVGGWISDAELAEFRVGCAVRRLQIDDQQLRVAYSGAVALVYPSLYEGFGLPILEAMACGCPVITTPFTSIPEAAGEAVLYIRDANELAEALCDVQKPSLREKLWHLSRQQLAKFTWERAAGELRDVLRLAAKQHSTGATPQSRDASLAH